MTEEYKTEKLLKPSKKLLSSPIIRDIEAATYSYGLLYEMEESVDKKFEMVEEMLNELSTKRSQLTEAYTSDRDRFTENLYHGNMTALSITLADKDAF